MIKMGIINVYKKYELKFDGMQYYTFMARPYDDAKYYMLYSNDKQKWKIVFDSKIVQTKECSFEEAIDYIEELNKKIKPIMIHF